MTRKLKKATDTATEATAPPSAMPAASGFAFTAPAKDLARALKRVSGFVAKRSTMPMLGAVCFRATASEVILVATDLDSAAVHAAPAWHVHGAGAVCVNAKALADVIKRMDGEITVRSHVNNGLKVMLTCGTLSITLDALSPHDFPKVPAILPGDALDLATADAVAFNAAIDAVSPSICRDETRFHMSGILLTAEAGSMRMITTDGHRLHKLERLGVLGAFQLANETILAQRGIAEVRRLLSRGTFEIGVLARSGSVPPFVVFRQNGTTVALKPIDAQFPAWQQVVPKDNRRLVTVERTALLACLERAAVVCTSTRGVQLECVPDGLKVTASHPDLGTASEVIPAELNPSEAFSTGANPRYLVDALKAITDDRVTLAFSHASDGALDPMVVRGTSDAVSYPVMDSPFLAVIMPMRI